MFLNIAHSERGGTAHRVTERDREEQTRKRETRRGNNEEQRRAE